MIYYLLLKKINGYDVGLYNEKNINNVILENKIKYFSKATTSLLCFEFKSNLNKYTMKSIEEIRYAYGTKKYNIPLGIFLDSAIVEHLQLPLNKFMHLKMIDSNGDVKEAKTSKKDKKKDKLELIELSEDESSK